MDNKNKYIEANNEIKTSKELKQKVVYKLNEKRPQKIVYKLANAMAVVLVLLGIIFITDEAKIKQVIIPETSVRESMNLPTVDNIQNLINLLKTSNANNEYERYQSTNFLTDATESLSADKKSNSDYSKTNTQVKGVDEGDIVKTDGKYIYYLSKSKLVVTTTGSDIKIVKEIVYKGEDESGYITPLELYVNENKLIVIIETFSYNKETRLGKQFVKAIEYDLRNISQMDIYREFEIEGQYISSRLKDDIIYMVTNKNIYSNNLEEDNKELLQTYKDTVQSNETKCIELIDVCYMPNTVVTSYLNISSFDINTKRDAKIETILGNGNNVYMSENNIYIANNIGIFNDVMLRATGTGVNKTTIYKFGIDKTRIYHIATQEIPGRIINQFAMDEYNGYFRIATTSTDSEDNKNINNIYVLDEKLVIVGKLENLAKDESIYSVRFIQDKVYMVTFKQVDPLFVIDLKNPNNPKVLGELKIPGYSTYLHPYDENHIIGFGQDTKTVTDTYGSVRTETTGIKMAMFDISDVNNPKELFNVKIGERGTSSELLYNHKTLLFSKEKNILAFPITISKQLSNSYRTETEFQGAIIYSVDLNKGFEVKGKISHIENKDNKSTYDQNYYYNTVDRIIYIENNLYTLSPATIKVTDMDNMKKIGEVEIKVEDIRGGYVTYCY